MLLNEDLEIAILCHTTTKAKQPQFLPWHHYKPDWLINGQNLERLYHLIMLNPKYIFKWHKNMYWFSRTCNGGQNELFGKKLLISAFGMLPWVMFDSLGKVSF